MIEIIGYIFGIWLLYAAISAIGKHKIGLLITSCITIIAGVSTFIATGNYESLIKSIIAILCISFIKPIQIKNDKKAINNIVDLNIENYDNQNDSQLNNDELNVNEQTIIFKKDDFNISIEQAKKIRNDLDNHKSKNLSQYIKKYKQTKDVRYLKDICKIIILMYYNNENVYITKENNVIDGVVIEWKSYMAVYTDEHFIPTTAKHKRQTITIRDFFASFYDAYNKNMCNGIIINCMSEDEFVLTKEGIDGLKLDLF